MKKFIFLGALLLSYFSHSQLGIVTIKPKEFVPTDQWYQVKGRKNKRWVGYYNSKEVCKEMLKRELEPYNLQFSDAAIDESGTCSWKLDHRNGFISVVLFDEKEDTAYIDVYTYPADED